MASIESSNDDLFLGEQVVLLDDVKHLYLDEAIYDHKNDDWRSYIVEAYIKDGKKFVLRLEANASIRKSSSSYEIYGDDASKSDMTWLETKLY